MKKALGVSAFNCRKEIFRSLDPMYKHFDVMVLIDGRYSNFEWPYNYSQDGWLEECEKRYPNVIAEKYFGKQIDKRQRYLDIAGEEKCDYLVVWDSDDYLYPDPQYQNWDLFDKNLEKQAKAEPDQYLYWMWCWIKPEWIKNHNIVQDNTWYNYIRVIKNPGDMQYYLTHYMIARKDDPKPHKTILWANSVIDGIRFTTDSVFRDKQFIDAGNNYNQTNMDIENKRTARYCFDIAMATAIPGTEVVS